MDKLHRHINVRRVVHLAPRWWAVFPTSPGGLCMYRAGLVSNGWCLFSVSFSSISSRFKISRSLLSSFEWLVFYVAQCRYLSLRHPHYCWDRRYCAFGSVLTATSKPAFSTLRISSLFICCWKTETASQVVHMSSQFRSREKMFGDLFCTTEFVWLRIDFTLFLLVLS